MFNLETLKVDQNKQYPGIVTVSLNRPDSMNAFNTQMAIDLIDCLTKLKDTDDLRIVLLTGSGTKSFCVGADLKERKGMSDLEWKKQHDIFEEAYKLLREFEYPTLCVINGYALGGGLELALSCDMRLMDENALVGLPESRVGIIPGVGGTQLLPRIIPIGVAKEMLFSGSYIDSTRAQNIGLVNGVFSTNELMEEAIKFAQKISENAPLSLKAIKQSVNTGIETDLNTALSIELSQYYKCAHSQDRIEGVTAFNEKRKPNWKGI